MKLVTRFAVLVCAVVLTSEGLPRHRVKRQTSTSPPSSGDSESTTTTTTARPNNEFGIGAAAGIGGLGRGVGIGNFNADTRNDAFAPWGAFAGLNLGNGGRIGAGCSGLSCGVQLGELVLATPQLLGIGRDFLNPQRNRQPETSNNADSLNPFSPGGGSGTGTSLLDNVQAFTQAQLAKFNDRQQEIQATTGENLSNFARFGSQLFGGNGTGLNLGGNSSSSSSSAFSLSSAEGGKPIFSSISSNVGPDGTVTTLESGSDLPEGTKITVKQGNDRGANGVFTATGVKSDDKGNPDNFRAGNIGK